jgi:RNA polymerase sigma factor (TIGR02999 family)
MSSADITALLSRCGNDRTALDELFKLLYSDLRRLARARLAENFPVAQLDTTGLAHEAYLRLRGTERIDLDSRPRFMAYVSQVLRSIIIDQARRHRAERRGGGAIHVTLDTNVAETVADGAVELEHINEALDALEQSDPRLKQVVEMRYFGGMSDEEIAEALGVSARTIRRDWQRARLMLSVALKS